MNLLVGDYVTYTPKYTYSSRWNSGLEYKDGVSYIGRIVKQYGKPSQLNGYEVLIQGHTILVFFEEVKLYKPDPLEALLLGII